MGFLSPKIKQQEEASMAIPLDPKQMVCLEELLYAPGGTARSPYQIAYREGDIHQRGVLGDGEGGRQRNGKKKRE